ncbi:MAG: glycosyltransferase [Chitinophagaceae bacterium]|nr:glycosyltransferase [Chitinophagaceae bacterium]MBL0201239.1 glycosyltransferase [Chitinophagaceae bacterium]
MTKNHLHIVSLDVPFPADYGGVVDLFYKIKALHQLGVKIHLHCFTKDRLPQDELNKYCETVNYYQRKSNSSSFSLNTPLIVNSRVNEALISNLQKDNYPVLLEGIHCTYYLKTGQLNNRKIIVRLHNAEFAYYKQLAKHEGNLFKKLYYLYESRLLKKYERAIAGKATFLAVSKQDITLYQQQFKATDIHYLPVFLPYTSAIGKEGKGCYCLYHGNLAINENEKAAIWLLQHVFNKVQIPFVIAGKKPSKRLEQLAHLHQHTCIVANPSDNEMQDIIGKAHVHVLPSLNNTGIKLKLLNALFNGRHCLVNKAGVEGSGLESYCHMAMDAETFRKQIEALYILPFTEQEAQQRQGLLQTMYNNETNARQLMTFLQ